MNSTEPDTGIDPILDVNSFRAEVRDLYQSLDGEVRSLAPVCVASGRCCRFEEYGHTLFLSAMEAALLLADAPPAVRMLDDGASCPWQDERGLCVAREGRPLGCRVYFCDPSYQAHASDLSEKYIGRLKGMADRHGLPWSYAPLHAHLRMAVANGAFPDDG